MVANNAQASITLSEAESVKLFGDVRIRGEYDARDDKNEDQYRWRFRARLGISFQPDQDWKARIRLRTNSDNNLSPHQTFGTTDNINDNADFGLDQAFVVYTGIKDTAIVMGKTPINFWQQNEVFWDMDIMPEAIEASYQLGPAKLNAAYSVLQDMGHTDDDVALYTYQALLKFGKHKLSIGGANLDESSAVGAILKNQNASQVWVVSGQMIMGKMLFGADLFDTDATKASRAWVTQFRYKLDKKQTVRFYYYNIEAYGLVADGTFTQDNFPGTNTNFKGYRLQYDYKISKKVNLDFRFYDKKIINKKINAGMTINGQSRAQMNINLKL